ncbi:hypothetical protein OV287_17920 [Archangium sp. miwbw1]|uniref:RCC1 repeat-containing protein n=1 Tax=Archangium lansingense TaxID=2995310 RepID=A0ABT4A4R7_9BACT|nr:hypothetical protein [Archangium lansinium]MCY1076356.1 hypothetical protein [Archangium lansinium]
MKGRWTSRLLGVWLGVLMGAGCGQPTVESGEHAQLDAPLGASQPRSRLAASENHSLALRPDGIVWAAGPNYAGGGGSTSNPMSVLSGAVAVAAGEMHSLAVRYDGAVWAWGANSSGQLGDGTTSGRLVPVQVQGLSGVVAVTAGLSYSLAVLSDGTAWAWGSNYFGQLGVGGVPTYSTTAIRSLLY